MDRKSLGARGEHLATQFLTERGYRIVARNWRKPWGELDIVAQKDRVISFIEVKANHTDRKGFEAELRANSVKMIKVIRTARSFLAQHRLQEQEWQVDVISVTFHTETKTATIKHFKNIEL